MGANASSAGPASRIGASAASASSSEPACMPATATAGRPSSSGEEHERQRKLVGRLGHHVAEAPQQLGGAGAREDREAGHHLRPDRVEPQLDRGHDAEVAAAAAQRPEQLGVLVGGRADRLAAGGDQLDGEDVVDGQAVLALEPARAAAEREPGDAGARDAPADGGEPVLLGGGVDLAPGQAAARADDPPLRVDDQLAQAADVDHEAVLDERRAGDRVAAAAHRDAHAARPRERERGADLVGMGDAGDVARARLDHRVEERAGVLVLGLAGVVDMASQRVAQLVQGGVMDDRHIDPRRPPRTGYS